MENEHANYSQHSISNSNNKSNIFSNETERQIPTMDSRSNEIQQNLLLGHNSTILPIYQVDQVSSGMNENFNINKNISIEERLDNIVLSDSDVEEKEKVIDNPISEEDYINKNSQINKFYEEDDEVGSYIPTKHELQEINPDFKLLGENHSLINLGHVMCIVEGNIMVEFNQNIKEIVDLDTTIYNQNKQIVGFVFDVIGNIDSPIYDIHPFNVDLLKQNGKLNEFDLNKFISVDKISVGENLYFDSLSSEKIDKNNLMLQHQKATDASNAYDEEKSSEEFSDDEKEIEYKQKKKQNNKNKMTDFKIENKDKKYKEDKDDIKYIEYKGIDSNLKIGVNNIDPFTFFSMQSNNTNNSNNLNNSK